MQDAIHNFHPQYQQYTQHSNPSRSANGQMIVSVNSQLPPSSGGQQCSPTAQNSFAASSNNSTTHQRSTAAVGRQAQPSTSLTSNPSTTTNSYTQPTFWPLRQNPGSTTTNTTTVDNNERRLANSGSIGSGANNYASMAQTSGLPGQQQPAQPTHQQPPLLFEQ
uniref:Uncharacterized protein n=1 Tax=Ditylenchus dipsaci TaxID=166011 RepID=A0A915DZ98_9BILA